MDYKLFYGLSFNPFEKGSKDTCIDTLDYKEMMGRLNYLKETKGFGIFTGHSGYGKTFTIRKFCEGLNPALYKVLYMPMSTLTTREFYLALSYELGLEPKNKKIDNFRQIQECILNMSKEKRVTPFLVLDEAQYLKTDVLNDLKMLFNFEFDRNNYGIVLLAGLPVLNNTLNKSIHEPLKQRVVIQYQSNGMNLEETRNYIQEKMKQAGNGLMVFNEGAITAINNACRGSSRKLNNIATQALIIGSKKGAQTIDNEIIMLACDEIA